MADDTTAGSAAAGRREQFEEDIAAVRIRTGKAEAEQRWTILGLVGIVLGIALSLIGFFWSRGLSDTRDVITALILAVAGVGITVGGAAIFLRYSFARFLRFWLLRLIYEQQADH